MADVVQDTFLIDFIDPVTGALIQQLGSRHTIQFQLDKKLNNIGTLVIAFPYEEWVDAVLVPDTIVEVNRLNPVSGIRNVQETFLVQRWQRFLDEGFNTQVVLGCFSLNHLLPRRVINYQDDPLGGAEYVTRDGIAGQVMRDYAYYQIGAGASAGRRLAALSINYVTEGDTVGGDYTYSDSLFKALSELAVSGKVDFQITRKNSNLLELDIRKIGTDKRFIQSGQTGLVFNVASGALLQPQLTINREKEVNVVYVAGDGKPGVRSIITRSTGEELASAWNRKEGFLAVTRSDEGAIALLTQSTDFLSKNRHTSEFTFTIDPNNQLIAYEVDWVIGDRVSVQWDETYELRIVGLSMSFTGGNETLDVELSQDLAL